MKAFYNSITKLISCSRNTGNKKILLAGIVFVLGMVSSNTVNAQNMLVITSAGLINAPDTVADGELWAVGVYIKNNSSILAISGDSVGVQGFIDSLQAPSTPYASPLYDSITILPGDSVFLSSPIFYTGTAGFHIGNNVIVVWPITTNPNFYPGDTLYSNVIVLDGVGIGPEEDDGELKCYPVPASGLLYITSTNRNLVVKNVVIRDVTGKIIAISDRPSEGIITETWASGTYLLEVTYTNGKKSNCKIIR